MKIKEYIMQIVAKGNPEDMQKLTEMLDEIIIKIKVFDEECYEYYKCELYEMVYGKNLTEEKAKHIIEEMKPYGMKWTLEQTRDVQRSRGLNNIRDIDFWVVMNSAYNDFHELFDEDLERYVMYTKLFIDDVDAVEGKTYEYFTKIVD